MRKRTQAKASFATHMRTMCHVGVQSNKISLAALPPPSMSGCLHAARINNVAQMNGNKGDEFVSYWVELRKDVLTFVKTDSKSPGRGITPVRVAFAIAVEPPPAAICTSSEMRAIASKLMSKQYIVLYTPQGHALWLECRSGAGELERWKAVRLMLLATTRCCRAPPSPSPVCMLISLSCVCAYLIPAACTIPRSCGLASRTAMDQLVGQTAQLPTST